MYKHLWAAALLSATSTASAFELTSPDIEAGGTIDIPFVANVFGCTGDNTSPALSWSGAPEGTGAYAIMVHDPDAPTGGAGFWHWIALNIPATEDGVAQGAGTSDGMPAGTVQIANDYGIEGWGGPCPPEGDTPHRYNFTLYALPAPIDVPDGASKAVIGFIVNASASAKAEMQATFGR